MDIKPAHDTTTECNVATLIHLYEREASNHEFLGKQVVIFLDKGPKIPYSKFFFRPEFSVIRAPSQWITWKAIVVLDQFLNKSI